MKEGIESKRQPIRIHPLLQAVEEVSEREPLHHSDHLPQLFTIPNGDQPGIKAITYNVCAGHPTPYDTKYGFSNEQSERARHTRIADGLVLAVRKQSVDVLMLQEVSKEQLQILQLKLGSKWAILSHADAAKNSTVTCCRKSKFASIKYNIPDKFNHVAKGIQTTVLQPKSSDGHPQKPIRLVNFWGEYYGAREQTEIKNYLYKILTNLEYNTVVAGDFNNPLRPPEYVTNQGIGRFAEAEDGDGRDPAQSIDGAIYAEPTRIFKNLEISTVNLYDGSDLPPPDWASRDKFECQRQIIRDKQPTCYRYDDNRPILADELVLDSQPELRNKLEEIQAEIDRLNTPQRHLRDAGLKATALLSLKWYLFEKMQGVRRGEFGVQMRQHIKDWEASRRDHVSSTKTMGEIIDTHRFVGLSEKRLRKEAITTTRAFINDLKDKLDLRGEIIDSLKEYIAKIEAHKKDNGEPNYHYGLWMPGAGRNREANYKLAQALLTACRDNPQTPLSEIFSGVEEKRRWYMPPRFAAIDRGINSQDLLKILNKANPDWRNSKPQPVDKNENEPPISQV